jgi:hypothetical protein
MSKLVENVIKSDSKDKKLRHHALFVAAPPLGLKKLTSIALGSSKV